MSDELFGEVLEKLRELKAFFQKLTSEERMRAIETYNLGNCSILTAIFYNENLKIEFEELIDYNLAPENRGW